MAWNNNEIKNHIKVAELLGKIKDECFNYLGQNREAAEYDVQQFILKRFKANKLATDSRPPIVAFRDNTSFVHYYPSQYSKSLEPESLIMIDIWARLNRPDSPMADITWMAYRGRRVSEEIMEIFETVVRARDKAINFIKLNLENNKIPAANKVDAVARDAIKQKGYGKNFLHGTGHSLGFGGPHGRYGRIWPKNNQTLVQNIGYTIEPGIYIKNRFGVRSEMNFYIDHNMNLVITTDIQKCMVAI